MVGGWLHSLNIEVFAVGPFSFDQKGGGVGWREHKVQ